ncbi:MAG: PH domain-containing protein [Gemmatimonadota bacterium]|nr:PH domain-containing protein [Gemmatimonadota bacterium]
MAENIDPRFASKSDEELHALEQDRNLPIDEWMAVEAERGRRERERQPGAAAATPAATPAVTAAPVLAMDDSRIGAGLAEFRSLLVPGEKLTAYAVQRRLFALVHRRTIVGATTGRFIALFRGFFGGYTPYDVRWQDLSDVSIRAGVFGADLTVTSMSSDDLGSQERPAARTTFRGLRKHEAQQVYTICQAQEQSWREKRRVRDLDELRAQSGGIQLGAQSSALGGAAASATGDPGERLRRAKEMLDAGLITDTEYESIKARVVDSL